jgi:transcriptional regulator with XRE-family HTH domain
MNIQQSSNETIVNFEKLTRNAIQKSQIMEEESTLKSRLEQWLKVEHITRREFADTIGVSRGYVSAMRQGMSRARMAAIARCYPKLNIDWLRTGHGSMYNDATSEQPRQYGFASLASSSVDSSLVQTMMIEIQKLNDTISSLIKENARQRNEFTEALRRMN